ncbi:MAG: sigma-70 family RNA polymerase sigma factor [Verrucomicrobiales bacterium]|nr:sigma-70 family RNA polymerase sigma factor [Verrucomicrobiales bacterium]
MDDWDLLNSYAAGSEAAFTDLLRRHVNHVYSTALRRAGDPAMAQDITQGVFCLLARKASSLQPTGSLVGWLHRTTCHLASESLRAERRRRARETEAALQNSMTRDTATDTAWQQVAPHLDEALLELKEPDRLALLLRFFQQLPLRDVGARLGVSEAAAKMRVGRAVMKLRQTLGARGITLTAGALVWLLTDRAVAAAPASCISAVSSAVAATTAGASLSLWSALVAVFSKGPAPIAAILTVLLLATLGTALHLQNGSTAPQGAFFPFPQSQGSDSNAPAFEAVSAEPVAGARVDPLDDPTKLEEAIARLRAVLRQPFGRRVPLESIHEAVNGLGTHASAAVPMVLEELRDAFGPGGDIQRKFCSQSLCIETLRVLGGDAREAIPELIGLLKGGKLLSQGAFIVDLFPALHPSAEQVGDMVGYLVDPETPAVYWNTEAVVRLMEQRPELLPSMTEQLRKGLVGAQPVRELALARTLAQLPGADLAELRPILEKHLMLPELRDPTHYLPVVTGSTTDLSPVNQRQLDDVSRFGAIQALAGLGDAARESLPALQELAARTTDPWLREQVLLALASIDPDQRFQNRDVAAVVDARESDRALMERIQSGSPTSDDLRSGLKGTRTADAVAAHIATLGDAGREFVPDLTAALGRNGSFEVAQALKSLAPDRLVPFLKNPEAFTPVEQIGYTPNPAHDALQEAAQALAELGPNGAFALPALREALEVPDKAWTRLTLEKAIHDIDPKAPVSLFTGGDVSPAKNALVQARIDAERAGNSERAQLADAAASRIEFNHGMTRRELLSIATDLGAADPELQAIYVQALWKANPSLRDQLVSNP